MRAIRRALEKAGLSPDDVEHVNAHATSTPEGDRTELDDAPTASSASGPGEVSVTANKSMLGHTLGAAGSIEAIVTMLSLRDGRHPADDQPRGPRRGGGRPGPDPERRPARAIRVARQQLVRVRGPEQRPRLPAVGRMTDDLARDPGRWSCWSRSWTPRRPATSGRRGRRRHHGARVDVAGASGLADASLLALVDRLAGILERSDLLELEVESGGTGIVLRKAAALAAPAAGGTASGEPSSAARPFEPRIARADASSEPVAPARAAVLAPLTGIFYASPTPGSAPFVAVGREVVVGQVIGLIEAMKLFNEIKSDKAGRVVRVVAENGALVKAKHPLIEVEPL